MSPKCSKEKTEGSSANSKEFEEDVMHRFRSGDSKMWWTALTLLMIATMATRFYSLGHPTSVCWDEVHFGKFAGWYINRTFFFDVHPPLGKMLIGLFGYLDGYNASFAFEKPGDKYMDYPYLGMRAGCALFGAMLVPLSFLTVWEMTYSLQASTFAGTLALLDHGMLTLNRYILLDPLLLFFISGSVYVSVKFHNQRDRAFSPSWWLWLSAVGVMLTCAISVKFVGLFVVILVGFRVIADLWEILGDLSRPVSYTVKHFLARALCLIGLPFVLYAAIFCVHLRVLHLSGPGDLYYSSRFQTTLQGNPLQNMTGPREVAYGAVIKIKNDIVGGAFLHSHKHLYPEGIGARHQQVTTYLLKDGNNNWIIKRADQPAPSHDSTDPIDYVRNGDLVRLQHKTTGRNLHSHRHKAPMTRRHFQVTGFGQDGEGDPNDIWRLEIEGGRENETLQVIHHKFRLFHKNEKCILTTTKQTLPTWGFEQQEVTCNPNIRDKSAVWNIEDNVFPRLPNTSFSEFAPNFIQRFIESHVVMVSSNAGFKPKDGEFTSKPWMWPINFQGQFFASDGDVRIYLLGNPIIWWANLFFMAVYLILYAVKQIRDKRGVVSSPRQILLHRRALHACGWMFIGWLLHYVPFWSMGRILYFHHYFPAVLFSSMLTAVMLDYLVESATDLLPKPLSEGFYRLLLTIIFAGLVYSFYLFAPLVYGMNSAPSVFSNSTMYGLRWLKSWEF